MKEMMKRYLPDVVVVVVFALMSFAYFYPADTQNRILYRHDASAGKGMGKEIGDYREKTGEQSRWTDAAFSGMPTYQTAPSYDSQAPMNTIVKWYHLGLPEYVWYLFVYLLGFYILMRAFDFKWYLAVLGSVIWALSSYFLIIIAAGHIWKVMALAYLPPMIAGIVLAYRGRYLWGFILTAIFAGMEINANHPQMTYYYSYIIILMALGYLCSAIKHKTLLNFAKASGVCLAGGLLGLAMNISSLYHTWEYQKESMRGGSEIVRNDKGEQSRTGLSHEYITMWSYGGDEMLTLMVPNANGGSHDIRLGENRKAMAAVPEEQQDFVGQWFQYWGEQSYTAGPVYVGAFVCLLFILALFIAKTPLKWPLFIATILSMLLSLGHNLPEVSDFFIDNVPMFNKFRTISSILVIAEFTMPLLAMLALKRLYDEPDYFLKKSDCTIFGKKLFTYKNTLPLIISFVLTAGVCLWFIVFPDTFDHFFSQFEHDYLLKMGADERFISQVKPALVAAREVVFTQDLWRSFWIICAGTAIIGIYTLWNKKLNTQHSTLNTPRTPAVVCFLLMAVLCLFDMWQVDKRYLNDKMFVTADIREQPMVPSQTDTEILKDKDLDYRVLNYAGDTFNENETSYFHKSIGGYHAAKLGRYNDLINICLSPEKQRLADAIYKTQGNMEAIPENVSPVLNMLNTKYLIFPVNKDENGNLVTMPLRNPHAMGNAWFVDKMDYVDNASDEIKALEKIDLHKEAVADKQFQSVLGEAKQQDTTSVARMTSYAPNHLEYDVQSKTGGVLVISEIYYPGWTCTVDGKDTELGRANYVLRALQIAPGSHKVVLDFHPQTVKTTETIAYVAYAIVFIVIIIALIFVYRKNKKR